MPRFSFLTLKAFGDYVIAYASLRGRVDASSHFAGAHLVELARAIDPHWCPTIIEHSETSVPAIFDVRKKGIVAATQSLWGLRGAVSRVPKGTVLVFDQVKIREKLLAGARASIGLPAACNIYLAYEAFFDSNGLVANISVPSMSIADTAQRSKVRIFASSRLEGKRLPVALCAGLISALASRGEEAELVILKDEYPELEATDLPKRVLPKSFKGMVDCVAESKFVISSDSLPAHIAELQGFRPVVVSPVDNSYWLPRSSLDTGAWSLFEHGVSGVLDAIKRGAS